MEIKTDKEGNRLIDSYHHRDVKPDHEFWSEIQRFQSNFNTQMSNNDNHEEMSIEQKIASGYASRLKNDTKNS